MCAKLRTLPSSIFLGGSVLVGMALSSATNLCGILSVAALYFVVNHHCGRANPCGYTMTPPTSPIILITLIIPIIPRLASPISTCVPQWSSSSFFGGSVLVGVALASATNLCGSFVSGGSVLCGQSSLRQGKPKRLYNDAPNNSHNSQNSQNSHNSQTGVAHLYMRAAVVIKQLFWRLCTRGNGSWALDCCSKTCLRLVFCNRAPCEVVSPFFVKTAM